MELSDTTCHEITINFQNITIIIFKGWLLLLCAWFQRQQNVKHVSAKNEARYF